MGCVSGGPTLECVRSGRTDSASPSDMEAPLLILASASPRRSELLRLLRPRFQIVPSPVAETHGELWSAGELARVNACRKARAVSQQFPDALIIGVDTLVAVETTIFGKPRTRAEARRMLAFLQGRTHQVTTGVCLVHWRACRKRVFFDQTDVTFRALTPAQIRRYHQKVNPLDKAGAYGIQEMGGELVESISGSFTNVVGLPLEKLRAELDAFLAGLAARPPRADPSAPRTPPPPASGGCRRAGL
jgi:septum formation protein